MADKEFMEVMVKEAARDDAGRGIARLSIEVMRSMGLVSGDVIEIQGKKKSTAIVWPGFQQDTGLSVLRIDGTIRSNAATGIDEKVRIRKVELGYAKKIVDPADPAGPARRRGGIPLPRPPRTLGDGGAARADRCDRKPAHLRHRKGGPEGDRDRHGRDRDRAEGDPVQAGGRGRRQRSRMSTTKISVASGESSRWSAR